MVTDKRIGVLAGGTSAEREVSLKSGNAIFKALQGAGYNAVFIDADSNLPESLKNNGVEIAFLALHGGHGENGAVQGLLEMSGIPYTGSGILASALAMDKEASKKIFLYHDIPVAPFVTVTRDELRVMSNVSSSGLYPLLINRYPLLKDLEMPWVVKPTAEGSSIGVSIVRHEEGVESAMESAFQYGDKVLIEKYIKGKEIQIGILGNKALGGVEVRPSKEFYSYEAKYTAGMTRYILPPEVDVADYELLKAAALKAHNALGCQVFSRVDFILDDAHVPYILEVNTLPGMTETSLFPKIAALCGMDFPQLVEEMLRLTISRA